jgi:hypothetical protein
VSAGRTRALLLAAWIAPGAAAAGERFAVVATGEPPAGIDAGLAEMTHQLRAACRDRVAEVLDVPTMQARLLGQSAGATLAELERAYGGALAVYQNGEFESALRTLRAIVEDLEALPESAEAFAQWTRAVLRLAHAASTVGREAEADAALSRLLRVEPAFRADPDQYSPTYRRRLDEVRARVRTLPQRRVTVLAAGRPGKLFVDGRPSGTTPMTLFLPAGRYRIGGSAGPLRVPSFPVDVTEEDRTVTLDFETADALRMTLGPGLVLPAPRRGEGLVRAGAWLDVDKLVVASRAVEGDAPFLVGAIFDVRRGALLREGSVRSVAGGVPSVNIGALAAFLLTGAQQREVHDRSPEPPPPPPATASPAQTPASPASGPPPERPGATVVDLRPDPRAVPPPGVREPLPAPGLGPEAGAPGRWKRKGAWIAGGLSAVAAGFAIERRLAAARAWEQADALLGPGGALRVSTDQPRFRALTADGDAAARNGWLSAGAAVLFGAVAGYLGWTAPPGDAPGIAF